jgi:AcrR family transcriptional regulator
MVTTSPTRRGRRDADAHRAAILEAAATVLSETPHAGLAGVAAAAGLTRTTVYAHFPSRRDLVTALVESVIGEGVVAWDSAATGGTAVDDLPGLLRATWRVLAAHPGIAAAAADTLGPEALTRMHEPLSARVRELVRRGVTDGSLADDVEEDWLVTLWFAAVHAAGQQARAGLSSERVERDLVTTLRRAFSRGARPAS